MKVRDFYSELPEADTDHPTFSAANRVLQSVLAGLGRKGASPEPESTSDSPNAYPFHVILPSGRVAHARLIGSTDQNAIADLYSGLEALDRELRFHSDPEIIIKAAERVATATYPTDHMQIVEVDGLIVAEGGYWGDKHNHTAKLDVIVAVNYRGLGLGTQLMRYATQAAIDNGYIEAVSEIPAHHANAKRIFSTIAKEFKLSHHSHTHGSMTEYRMSLKPTIHSQTVRK